MFLASLSLSNRPSCTHSPLLLLLIIICHFCASNLHFKKCCIAALKLIINLSSVPSIDTFLTLILLPVRGREGRGMGEGAGERRSFNLVTFLWGSPLVCCYFQPCASPKRSGGTTSTFPLARKRSFPHFESRKFSPCRMQHREATTPLVWPGISASVNWSCTDKLSLRLNSEVYYMPMLEKEIWLGFIWPTQSAVWAYSSISSSQWLVGYGPNTGYLLAKVIKHWKCSHLLSVCQRISPSLACSGKESGARRDLCVRCILERWELLANSVSVPTPGQGCAKCYKLPEGGAKGSDKMQLG